MKLTIERNGPPSFPRVEQNLLSKRTIFIKRLPPKPKAHVLSSWQKAAITAVFTLTALSTVYLIVSCPPEVPNRPIQPISQAQLTANTTHDVVVNNGIFHVPPTPLTDTPEPFIVTQPEVQDDIPTISPLAFSQIPTPSPAEQEEDFPDPLPRNSKATIAPKIPPFFEWPPLAYVIPAATILLLAAAKVTKLFSLKTKESIPAPITAQTYDPPLNTENKARNGEEEEKAQEAQEAKKETDGKETDRSAASQPTAMTSPNAPVETLFASAAEPPRTVSKRIADTLSSMSEVPTLPLSDASTIHTERHVTPHPRPDSADIAVQTSAPHTRGKSSHAAAGTQVPETPLHPRQLSFATPARQVANTNEEAGEQILVSPSGVSPSETRSASQKRKARNREKEKAEKQTTASLDRPSLSGNTPSRLGLPQEFVSPSTKTSTIVQKQPSKPKKKPNQLKLSAPPPPPPPSTPSDQGGFNAAASIDDDSTFLDGKEDDHHTPFRPRYISPPKKRVASGQLLAGKQQLRTRGRQVPLPPRSDTNALLAQALQAKYQNSDGGSSKPSNEQESPNVNDNPPSGEDSFELLVQQRTPTASTDSTSQFVFQTPVGKGLGLNSLFSGAAAQRGRIPLSASSRFQGKQHPGIDSKKSPDADWD